MAAVLIFTLLWTVAAYGQFNSTVQGVVTDASGAAVPGAMVTLLNVGTHVSQSAKTDSGGIYHFVFVAPGSYQVSAENTGFAKTTVGMILQTGQTLNLPLRLVVTSVATTVEVSSQAPLLDTAETRNNLTIANTGLEALPLSGRNMIGLVTLAPGAVGLGVATGNIPGTAVDNFSTELQVDVSANGQGSVANMYVVDGLDVTSSVRPGVLNLTPDPDSIEETSIETNTFTVDYGRGSSIEMLMTTKAGTDQYHGSASDYFNYNGLFAKTEFIKQYAPFHSNNMAATFGGPIIPHHQLFGFFSIEPMRESVSTGFTSTTFEAPAFTAWAKQNYPNTIGTQLLTGYAPSDGTVTSVAKTAAQIFPTTCGTVATDGLPCSTPMLDNGVFNSTNYRNGTQWNLRVDKNWKKDRLYGTVYRTVLHYGGGTIRPEITSANENFERAFQVNEVHTFSSKVFNEAIFGVSRIQGIDPYTGTFKIPVISVTGMATGFGVGNELVNGFIQPNYHWRDAMTIILGTHTLSFGYEGWHGVEVTDFEGDYAQPHYVYNNLLNLAQDQPYDETGVSYNILTGQFTPWSFSPASKSWGLFAQDDWKATKTLTLNYGVRYDNGGNPYPDSPVTIFGDFLLGPGATRNQQIANGSIVQESHALNHSMVTLSPRGGFAWNIGGKDAWVVRGGAGIYHNWPTIANVAAVYRGDPPGLLYPTFYSGTSTPPIVSIATSNTYPFGYTYPSLPPGTLNSHGGFTGLQESVGAIDPNALVPVAYIYSGTLERKVGNNAVAGIIYSGAHGSDLFSGGSQQTAVSYGVDINEFPGDLIQCNCSVPTRLNSSFGKILYTVNDRVSNYNGLTFDFNGRYGSTYISGSFTRSASNDDAGVYPLPTDPHQFYGPSIWDAPNRLSLSGAYRLPGLEHGRGFLGRITGGWRLSGTSIYQTGYPFTVQNTASFLPLKSNGQIVGFAPGSGDYLANGDNFSYPNVTSYAEHTSRSAFLAGKIFGSGAFTAPALATNGNEKVGQFREPSFAETDAALAKDTVLTERLTLQLRFEFYNLFNRPNLNGVDVGMTDASFGQARSQELPRWLQFEGKLSF
jgi:hypothetical protein